MKQRSQDFALGLTTIVVFAVLLGTILFLYPTMRRGGRQIEIHFLHDKGLAPIKKGSPVLLAGSLEVGTVRSVRIAQTTDPAGKLQTVFIVQAEIQPDVPLYGNCRITTGQPPIGGVGYVAILHVGTPDVPLQQPLQGLPAQSLAAMLESLSTQLLSDDGLVAQLNRAVNPTSEGSLMYKTLAILDDLNAVTRAVREQMSPQERTALLYKVHTLLDNLGAATSALRSEMSRGDDAALLSRLHVALAHLDEALLEGAALVSENRPTVRAALASIENTTRTVDQELVGKLRGEFDPTSPTSLLGKVHLTMDRLNAALENVHHLTVAGQQMVALSRPTLEKILEDVHTVTDNLRHTSQMVNLNPSILLWGPPQFSTSKLAVFSAAKQFADAARQLDEAAARLEAIMQTLPPDGSLGAIERSQLDAIRAALQAAFERFGRAEQLFWEQLR